MRLINKFSPLAWPWYWPTARLIVLLLGAVLPAPYGPAAAEDANQRIQEKFPKVITGKVVAIEDGDTVTVLNDNRRSYKIRLKGIDAPEKGQDDGKQSKKPLSEKIYGQRVDVHSRTSARYRWFKSPT